MTTATTGQRPSFSVYLWEEDATESEEPIDGIRSWAFNDNFDVLLLYDTEKPGTTAPPRYIIQLGTYPVVEFVLRIAGRPEPVTLGRR